MSQIVSGMYGGVVVRRTQDRPPLIQTPWFITGSVKSGKTSFLCSIERCLILDFEGKVRYVPDSVRKAGYAHITKLSQLDSLMDQLEKDAGNPNRPFDMVAFDTVDEAVYGVVIPDMTEELFKGRPDLSKQISDITEWKSSESGSGGWNDVTKRFLSYPKRLTMLGYGCIVTGHLREKQATIRENGKSMQITTYRPAVNPGVFGGLYRWAVFIGQSGIRSKRTSRMGKTKDGRDCPVLVEEQLGVMTLREKPGDSGAEAGANVSMPAELEYKIGEGWTAALAAYQKTDKGNEVGPAAEAVAIEPAAEPRKDQPNV